MRKLSKPWAPENVSADGRPPRRFVDAEREYLAQLPTANEKAARTHFDDLDKSKLRAVMYREQGELCVYCERRISEGHPEPRIDHWRPLSRNRDLAFHWKNLYLSCTFPGTCDIAKGGRPFRDQDSDPDLPWPTDLEYEKFLNFTSRGEIYVRADAIRDEGIGRVLALAIDKQPVGTGYRSAILNLNHPALVAERAAAIDSERTRMAKKFPGRTATRVDRQQRATALFEENPLRPFVSVRAAWLRNDLGQGR